MDELKLLIDEIEKIQEQLMVVQESLFSDDEEIEALEESLKEKVGELGSKMKQKFYDLAAKTYKKPEKIQAAIDKAEKENAEMSAELEKREINGEKFRAKLGRFAWYSVLGSLEPFFGPKVKPTKLVRNCIKFNNMWMSSLNKRKAELEAKSEPAQESFMDMEMKALMYDINCLQEQLMVVQESLFADDSEIEALEESLKEKVGDFNAKMKQKFYDLAAKTYKKPEKLQAAIDKAEKENEELKAELEKREIDGEKFRAKLGRCVWYSVLGSLEPFFGPNVKPTKLVRNAVRLNNMWLSALNKRKAELEAKSEPAQESYFDFEFLDEE